MSKKRCVVVLLCGFVVFYCSPNPFSIRRELNSQHFFPIVSLPLSSSFLFHLPPSFISSFLGLNDSNG